MLGVSTCLGCGCTDVDACTAGDGTGCHWILVDRRRCVGVCSSCVGGRTVRQLRIAIEAEKWQRRALMARRLRLAREIEALGADILKFNEREPTQTIFLDPVFRTLARGIIKAGET